MVKLDITPVKALIDIPRHIRVRGLKAGTEIRLHTETQRGQGIYWRSQAVFVADNEGVVDTSRDAPIRGDYQGVDGMGLIFSQVPDSPQSNVFPDDVTQHLITKIFVYQKETLLAQGEMIQILCTTETERIEVRDNGLVGTLFKPKAKKAYPAIIVLNGSGGGINEPRAALYAAHGYIAFALAYFKAPGLSDYISHTPLEYFVKGIDWLRTHYSPKDDFVALSGQSRGGELVLLLASLFPEKISAVIAFVPGAVVHSAQNAADPKLGREGYAWLLDGKPIPHVWENNKTATWAPFDEGEPPHRHELAIKTALQDSEAVARARIRVEGCRCPILLISAEDDGAWPSQWYSQMVMDTLAQHHYPYIYRWSDHAEAGHTIVFPHIPTTQVVHTHPVSKRLSTQGGNMYANAKANQQAWADVVMFLRDCTNIC